jgi:hypothetical protein
MKETIYLETTVVSYLTAKDIRIPPVSLDLITMDFYDLTQCKKNGILDDHSASRFSERAYFLFADSRALVN